MCVIIERDGDVLEGVVLCVVEVVLKGAEVLRVFCYM